MKIDKQSVIVVVVCIAILVGFVSWVFISNNQSTAVTTTNTSTTGQIDHFRYPWFGE